MRAWWPAVLATSLALALPAGAYAQVAREACPDVASPPPGDPVGAAEQALCWYERDREQSPGCVATSTGSSSCITQAARWCDDANLELDPQVPNACFLARVRERQLDEAARIAPLLVSAWREVEPCRAAVIEGVSVQVTTAPAGGVIYGGGQRVGETRAQIRLAAPFWRQTVSAAFGDVRADVTPEELVEHFDLRTCSMRPLLIERPPGPPASPSSGPPVAPVVAGARPATRGGAARRRTGVSVPGMLVGAGGVALAAVGSVLLVVAERTASDIRGRADGTEWSQALQGDYDSIGPLRVGGGALVGLGALSIGAGALLLALHGGGDSSREAGHGGRLSVAWAGHGFVLSGDL